MLVRAGVICASPLIPFDTVALWDVPRLVSYCLRSVRRGGTQVASDSFPVGFKLFPVQVSANCGHQELVGLLVSAIFGTLILLQVVCHGFAVFHLIEK